MEASLELGRFLVLFDKSWGLNYHKLYHMVREASLQVEKLTIISFLMSPLLSFPPPDYRHQLVDCFEKFFIRNRLLLSTNCRSLSKSSFYLCSIFDFNSSSWGFNVVVIYAKKTLNVRSSWPWTISSVPTKTNSFWDLTDSKKSDWRIDISWYDRRRNIQYMKILRVLQWQII